MMKMKFIKNKIIKMLGGYTEKEMKRANQMYQGLLDSNIDNRKAKIVNDYLYRMLKAIETYAQKELYGLEPDEWAKRMYNVIHNNFMRLLVRYLTSGSSIIYQFDTTIDNKDQFLKIMSNETGRQMTQDEFDEMFILETD